MTHTYQITGMTCSSCEAKIKSALLTLPGITSAEVSKQQGRAIVTMSEHVSLSKLQKVIEEKGKYQITASEHNETVEQSKTWLATYKPVLLIFVFITTVTLFIQTNNHHFMFMQWMQHFMAGFFLTFSFFKFLNLKGFAESYAMYDIIAKRLPVWAYIYAFLELALGLAFAINFYPAITNTINLVLMSVSMIGVLQSVFNKRKIRCACLGTVFNLPMSTVTIIEDALMIGMSAAMLLFM